MIKNTALYLQGLRCTVFEEGHKRLSNMKTLRYSVDIIKKNKCKYMKQRKMLTVKLLYNF